MQYIYYKIEFICKHKFICVYQVSLGVTNVMGLLIYGARSNRIGLGCTSGKLFGIFNSYLENCSNHGVRSWVLPASTENSPLARFVHIIYK